MDTNLDLTVNRALNSARVLERALHGGQGAWTLEWAGMEVPVTRTMHADGITFTAEFPSRVGVHIPITQGYDVLVDEADRERVSRHSWSVSESNGRLYAHANVAGQYLRLHQFLVETDLEVDHINGDGLDNRRGNLRVATRSQNMANRGAAKSNTSGYKGVSWHKASQKWKAQIGVDGRTLYLGTFDRSPDAARAYDAAAVEHFGEFAVLNFLTSPYPVALLKVDGEAISAKTIGYPGEGPFTVEWTMRARVIETVG